MPERIGPLRPLLSRQDILLFLRLVWTSANPMPLYRRARKCHRQIRRLQQSSLPPRLLVQVARVVLLEEQFRAQANTSDAWLVVLDAKELILRWRQRAGLHVARSLRRQDCEQDVPQRQVLPCGGSCRHSQLLQGVVRLAPSNPRRDQVGV